MGGAPIMWQCFKETRSSRSSCEAEIKASDECVKAVQFFRNVLEDMGRASSLPTTVYNDNRSATDWGHSMSTKRMRHYNIPENCVREAILFQEIFFSHIADPLKPGDIMTKEYKNDEKYRDLRDIIVY